MFKKTKLASVATPSDNTIDLSRRNFLISSSVVSAATMVPLTSQAAVSNYSRNEKSSQSLNLDNLINIFPHAFQSNFNGERVSFNRLNDEAQYIANRMLTEVMKTEMYYNYSVIGEFNGQLDPIWSIYNIPGISTIHNEYKSLIRELAPIYVSQILQQEYADTTDINNYTPRDRRALNSWDMIKANAEYNNAKSSNEFNEMMSRLYNIAIDYAEESYSSYFSGSALKAYKDSNSTYHWGEQLYKYYNSEETIQTIIDDNKISSSYEDQNHVAEKFAKVQSIFSKLRCLAYTDNRLTVEQVNELEDKYFSVLILGMAHSIKIGAKSEKHSLRNNRKVHIDTLNELLKPESATSEFWQRFIDEYGNGSLEIAHTMIYEQSSSADTMGAVGPNFISRIKNQYPMFQEEGINVNQRSSRVVGAVHGEAALFQFLLGIALGHLIYTTVEDENPGVNVPELISFSSAVVDAGKGILYLVLVTQIKNYFLGKVAGVSQTGGPLASAANFYLNFARNFKSVQKAETKIITQIFMKSKIASIAERVSLVFGVAALGVAVYNFAEAIISGDIAAIVFEAINTLIGIGGVTFGALALAGVSMAGPIGIAIAIVGGIVAIVQWLWEIFGPKHIPPSPIQNYTHDVVQTNGFIYQSSGYFLAAKKNSDGRGELFQFHVNELLWENGNHNFIAFDRSISDPGAVCDHDNQVYIYDSHATNGIPQVVAASLSGSRRNLYSDWQYDKSDLISSVKCVAVYSNYAYGVCQLTNYSKGVYKWLAGQQPPTENDRVYITQSDHPSEEEIQWICKTNNKIWALSFTRLYEFVGNSLVQRYQFRSNAEEDDIFEINACTDGETIFITTNSYAAVHGDPNFSVMTEIITNKFDNNGEYYAREIFTSQAPIRMTTVAHSEDASRQEFISMSDDTIQRQGILLKNEAEDSGKAIDLITGVSFPNSDGGWNGSKLLSNVRLRK